MKDYCKTVPEIKEFLAKNIFTFSTQSTKVNKDIYHDKADAKFDEIEDNGYYPLQHKTKYIFQKQLTQLDHD